jgi:hypothetical protein
MNKNRKWTNFVYEQNLNSISNQIWTKFVYEQNSNLNIFHIWTNFEFEQILYVKKNEFEQI